MHPYLNQSKLGLRTHELELLALSEQSLQSAHIGGYMSFYLLFMTFFEN
jgi:hypothetical protein